MPDGVDPSSVEAALRTLFPIAVSGRALGEDFSAADIGADEWPGAARAAPARRREFAGGRAAARAALHGLGFDPVAIPRQAGGAPHWPAGAIGSITHIGGLYAAVAARADLAASIGLDAAAIAPLPDGVARLVCTAADRVSIESLAAPVRAFGETLVFCAKEAFYKAYFPIAARFLEFHDVSIELRRPRCDRQGAFGVRFETPNLPLAERAAAFEGRWLALNGLILAGATLRT